MSAQGHPVPQWPTLLWDSSLPYKYDPTQLYLVIRFIYEPGIVSSLIDWETNSLWCHTEALSRDGKSWIGAHAGRGVQARPLNWCKPTRERRYALPVTPEQYQKAMEWLEAKQGEPYNYEDIVGLLFHIRVGVSKHEVICSALMTLWLMKSVVWWPMNVLEGYANLVTPETLHESKVLMGHCIYDLAA